MTVFSTELPRIRYACNGITDKFPITFPYTIHAAVKVVHLDETTNDETNFWPGVGPR
jgi:hypothetical protein